MTGQDAMPERLGAYRLLDRIGEGGMGVVFLARGPDGQTAALKVLRSGVADDPTGRRRLAREVATMRRVRSPYVAEVIDADLEGGTPYIVTRHVPGRTLDALVAETGPLRGRALAALACGLAEALVAVHAAGVVHRDLKPGNVILRGGLPVVIDFGIAQGPDATRLTLTGMFMGTPGYLSPEVIEGHSSSEASDVHAWGATVAFAATGRPPFGTGPYEAIFYRIVNGQPDLAGAPPAMLPLLASALARDPAYRPSAASLSAQSAALDAGSLASGAVPGARPPAPAGPRPAQPTRADVGPGEGDVAAEVTGGPEGDAPPGGTARFPGTAELAGAAGEPGWLSPDDFADVLPPVEYQPAAFPGPGDAPLRASLDGEGPPAAVPAAQGGPAGARTGWYSVMVVAAMAAAVGASVVLPVAGTLTALALIMLLRAGELAAHHTDLRRMARGPRASDPVLAAAAFPWFLARSVLASVLLAPPALGVAAAVGGITVAVVPGHPLPRAIAYAAGALIAFYGLGPGSGRSRRQLGRIFAAAVSTRMAQATALIGLLAFAAATLAAAVSWPSIYWPTAPPSGLPFVGRLHHLGMVGQILLLHRHGW